MKCFLLHICFKMILNQASPKINSLTCPSPHPIYEGQSNISILSLTPPLQPTNVILEHSLIVLYDISLEKCWINYFGQKQWILIAKIFIKIPPCLSVNPSCDAAQRSQGQDYLSPSQDNTVLITSDQRWSVPWLPGNYLMTVISHWLNLPIPCHLELYSW